VIPAKAEIESTKFTGQMSRYVFPVLFPLADALPRMTVTIKKEFYTKS
jgi:hypothetical protein